MTTLYNILLVTTGLSQREASVFHGVRPDTVKSWSAGRNPAPDGAIDELADLITKMASAVDAALDAAEAQEQTAEAIELGLASDDHEAQSLGWPTASVHRVVIGRIAAELHYSGRKVSVVPRGSTIATAAASDIHEL